MKPPAGLVARKIRIAEEPERRFEAEPGQRLDEALDAAGEAARARKGSGPSNEST
jgi:hypothetical protein